LTSKLPSIIMIYRNILMVLNHMSMLWMSDPCLRHQTGVPFSARSGILLLQTNVGRKWGDDLHPPSAPKMAK
jgi:hypothetical protein